jgi:hypothetical protein
MKKKFEIDLDERVHGIDNTIQIRTLQLVCYQGKVLTLEEYMRVLITKNMEKSVDKKIKKLKKDTKKLEKEEASLLKADQKRDKLVEIGEKAMKKKKKR